MNTPKNDWPPFLVAGAMLPYRSCNIWLKRCKNLPKGRDIAEPAVLEVLDFMQALNIRGILIGLDHRHTTEEEIRQYRSIWLSDVYKFAELEPTERAEALRHYCKEMEQLSLHDFSKTLTFLEAIAALVKQYLSYPNRIRTIDQRKITTLIDDQSQRVCPCLKHFLHYFLNVRGQQGYFSIPEGTKAFSQFVRYEKEKRLLNTNKLLGDIHVFEKGNLDDQFPQLKIADCLASFTRRTIMGNLSPDVAKRLVKILEYKDTLHLNPNREVLNVTIPHCAKEQVNIIFKN